jgi:hypothetical protein
MVSVQELQEDYLVTVRSRGETGWISAEAN